VLSDTLFDLDFGNLTMLTLLNLSAKGRHDPSVRTEGHADSRYGIVTVGITCLHFTLSTTRHGLESSTSWSL